MTYHVWGDDWPYWDDLKDAEQYISEYVCSRTECGISMKEKYGTLRYEFIWVPSHLDYVNMHSSVIRHLKDAVMDAVDKWPHIKLEITEDFNPEFL
jgi:hypothetical protein